MDEVIHESSSAQDFPNRLLYTREDLHVTCQPIFTHHRELLPAIPRVSFESSQQICLGFRFRRPSACAAEEDSSNPRYCRYVICELSQRERSLMRPPGKLTVWRTLQHPLCCQHLLVKFFD
jgi:hypothetical protein